MVHELPIRVYYEDTDAGGIVYYPNYLKFSERGRTEFLRTLGYENSKLREDFGILFVVRHLEADYYKPCFLDDLLHMKTSVESLKKTSFLMKQTLHRGDEMVFELLVTLVCVNAQGKPDRMPEMLRNVLTPQQET